ncbi:hypothetical protein Tco_0398538 [Tanacetum coccineum]
MRTRSQSRNQNRPQQQAPPVVVEPFNFEEPFDMAANGAGGAGPPPAGGGGLPVPDLRTMEELCQPSLDGRDTFYNALNANDQDSLNSAAGGNFLDKMPRECLRIIESKSKVRNSRNKAVVAKVSSNSSTPGISPDVAALTTEVSELKNMMKTMLIEKQKAQAPAPVKAVEQSCVTCGGAHSYRNCPATDGNIYQDNIQE